MRAKERAALDERLSRFFGHDVQTDWPCSDCAARDECADKMLTFMAREIDRERRRAKRERKGEKR